MMSVQSVNQRMLYGRVIIDLMTKQTRVYIASGMSDVEIENEVNSFLIKNPHIDVVNIRVNQQMFKDDDGIKCYFMGTIVYKK